MMLHEQTNVLILPQALRADENFQECVKCQMTIRSSVNPPELSSAFVRRDWDIVVNHIQNCTTVANTIASQVATAFFEWYADMAVIGYCMAASQLN